MKEFTTIDFLAVMAAHDIREDVPPDRWKNTAYGVRDILVANGIPDKVIWSCATTAANRGYWNNGVTNLAGWVTVKGMERLRALGVAKKQEPLE